MMINLTTDKPTSNDWVTVNTSKMGTSFPPINQTFKGGNYSNNTDNNYWNFPFYTGDSCQNMDCIFERYRRINYQKLFHISIFLGIIGLIGAVGNVIVIMVFARNRVKKTSTYYMLTLAIIDLMVCTIVIPGVIAREWDMKFYTDVLCKGLEFMRSLMIPGSALILVAIAFDRYFLICMSTKEVMTLFRTKIVIGVIIFIGMSLGVPPSLFMSVYVKDGDEMENFKICVKSDLYMDQTAQYEYWYFVTALFGCMTLTIMVLYSLIFKKVLQQSWQWRSRRKIFPIRRNTAGPAHSKHVTDHFSPDKRASNKSITKVVEISITPSVSHTIHATQQQQQPSCSGINTKSLKTRDSKQAMATSSSSANIKTLSEIKKRSAHVKTTQVLFIVTLVYIFSFLPTFLETNLVLEPNKYLTYVYFINNAANPIIYSFMNQKFRDEARRLYCKCLKK